MALNSFRTLLSLAAALVFMMNVTLSGIDAAADLHVDSKPELRDSSSARQAKRVDDQRIILRSESPVEVVYPIRHAVPVIEERPHALHFAHPAPPLRAPPKLNP
jgi:hypothetical protein